MIARAVLLVAGQLAPNEEVNRMLLEARELGEELDDVEIEGEALSWLVPSYVVPGDHDAARERLGQLLRRSRGG